MFLIGSMNTLLTKYLRRCEAHAVSLQWGVGALCVMASVVHMRDSAVGSRQQLTVKWRLELFYPAGLTLTWMVIYMLNLYAWRFGTPENLTSHNVLEIAWLFLKIIWFYTSLGE